MQLLHWTWRSTQKNQKKNIKKNKKKSPLSIHHTTQLRNFYIGPDDQPKKIKNKIKLKSPISLYYYLKTFRRRFEGDLTIIPKSSKGIDDQPKKIKKNHLYLYTIQLNYATSTLDLTINQKNRIKITFIYTP